MEKNYLIQLTQNLYCLTLLFPKKEPLRYKMREVADDILADVIALNNRESLNQKSPASLSKIGEECNQNLEVLDGFFEIVKAQNWVPIADVLGLQKEYERIKLEVKKILKDFSKNEEPLKEQGFIQINELMPVENSLDKSDQPNTILLNQPEPAAVKASLNSRQEKILQFLEKNGRAQVWQIKEILPEVTKRTLRRDFDFLLKQGKIERMGEKNNTFYRLRS